MPLAAPTDVRPTDSDDASVTVDVLTLDGDVLLWAQACCGGETDHRPIHRPELHRDRVDLSDRERPRGGGGGFAPASFAGFTAMSPHRTAASSAWRNALTIP